MTHLLSLHPWASVSIALAIGIAIGFVLRPVIIKMIGFEG